MNRQIDYETLKMQNYQLKNQLTDMKNGFDLNRQVIKILECQVREAHPSLQIYYQLISRLTAINNQLMVTNVEHIQQKNKLQAQNKKIQNLLHSANERIEELSTAKDCLSPKEIHLQMKDENKDLRAELMALSEECLRKNMQIAKMQALIKDKQKEELKKPIIPSVRTPEKAKTPEREVSLSQIPKTYETKQLTKLKVVNKALRRENHFVKMQVEELEYRLTLLSRLYQAEPQPEQHRFREARKGSHEPSLRNLEKKELDLLLFALNGTALSHQNEGATRVSLTNRLYKLISDGQHREIIRSQSCKTHEQRAKQGHAFFQ